MLPANEEATLVRLYLEGGQPADRLPYSESFERLFAAFLYETGRATDRRELWWELLRLRKARRLPTCEQRR